MLKKKKYASMLNGYMPIFSQFGQDIYASDVVQTVCILYSYGIEEIAAQHIRGNNGDPMPVNSNIQRLLKISKSVDDASRFLLKRYSGNYS